LLNWIQTLKYSIHITPNIIPNRYEFWVQTFSFKIFNTHTCFVRKIKNRLRISERRHQDRGRWPLGRARIPLDGPSVVFQSILLRRYADQRQIRADCCSLCQRVPIMHLYNDGNGDWYLWFIDLRHRFFFIFYLTQYGTPHTFDPVFYQNRPILCQLYRLP